MTYEFAFGERSYSSWSMRIGLLLDKFAVPHRSRFARFYCDEFADLIAEFAPARTVPALRLTSGHVIADSLAIAEELASRHPDAAMWPADPDARASARMVAAEMHSGFAALRTDCPMDLRVAYRDVAVSDAVLADVARIEALWTHARAMATDGPWLFGAYSIADAFYAPVAARIAGYDLPVGKIAARYIATHLADPAFRRWRAMGLVDGPDQPAYARAHARRFWPGPVARAAEPVADGPSENTACPYSGKPVTDFLLCEGRVFGFCNPFCRDKTVADPDAWPAFRALLDAR